jgi:hypothetical protein
MPAPAAAGPLGLGLLHRCLLQPDLFDLMMVGLAR